MAINFDNITNFFQGSSLGKLAGNFSKTASEFGKVLYRDGSNVMTGPLDMNSRRILNVPDPIDANDVVNLKSVKLIADDISKGPSGPANSTYTSLASLKAAPQSNRSYILADGSNSPVTYAYVAGDFTGRADNLNVVKLDAVPLTTGALVRQAATGVNFDGRSTDAKLRETVSVTDARFAGGAKGDGTTNDSAAFQAAIDFVAAAGGGYIVLPAGKVFFLNTAILLRDNVAFTGYGAKIIAGRGFAGPNNPLFKNFTGTQFTEQSTRTASKNVGFYGIEWDGQDVGIAGELIPQGQVHGVMICVGNWYPDSGIDGLIARDCYFHNMAGTGVMAWKSTNVQIDGNRFENFFANVPLSVGSGIDFHEVSRSSVTRNKINHTAAGKSWHGMVLLDWDAGCSELVVTDNVITNMNEGDGISCEGNKLDNLANSVIANNVIRNCNGQGIGADRCLSVTITSNTIIGVTGPGILFTETDDAVITDNIIAQSGLGGILSLSGSQRYVVSGNRISSITYTDNNYRGEGITVNDSAFGNTKQGIIADNVIRDTAGAGIYCLNYGSVISANSIYNCGTSPSVAATLRAGIIANAPNVVSGNYIRSTGLTGYGISSIAGDFPSIEANRLDGIFATAMFYIGYRQTGVNLNLSVNIDHATYDARSNIFKGYVTGMPAGFWYAGDDFDEKAPNAGQPWGYRCITTGPGNFKSKGNLAA